MRKAVHTCPTYDLLSPFKQRIRYSYTKHDPTNLSSMKNVKGKIRFNLEKMTGVSWFSPNPRVQATARERQFTLFIMGPNYKATHHSWIDGKRSIIIVDISIAFRKTSGKVMEVGGFCHLEHSIVATLGRAFYVCANLDI